MYKRVVRAILSSTFAGLNQGRSTAVTSRLSPQAEHFFIGRHALCGTRRTPASISRWYQRLFQLFPDIRFTVHRIDVSGPPWRTLATIEWSETNTGTDGVRTENEGVNVVEIRWGKVRRISIYTDTDRLVQTLNRLALAGNPAAHAEPIVDP